MAAGLGFKTFSTGDVLTANDTNGYLMQGVWVFASAAARTSAVTSPQEGNVSFLKDTNSLEIYDGAAWVAYGSGDITGVTAGTGISGGGTAGTVTITNSMATAIDAKGDLIVGTAADTFDRLAVGGTNGHVLTVDSSTTTGLKWAGVAASGKVLQVVSTTYSTRVDVASTTYTDTGLSLAITPTLATSKVLVIAAQHVWTYRATNEAGCRIKLVRGATDIWNQSTTAQTIQQYAAGSTANENANFISFSYLDSPATTSSTTYKVQGRAESTANSGDVSFQKAANVSTMTLLEIGA